MIRENNQKIENKNEEARETQQVNISRWHNFSIVQRRFEQQQKNYFHSLAFS